jgi:hypothetical protein
MRLGPSAPAPVGGVTGKRFSGMLRHGRAVSWQPDPKPSPLEIQLWSSAGQSGGIATAQSHLPCLACPLAGSVSLFLGPGLCGQPCPSLSCCTPSCKGPNGLRRCYFLAPRTPLGCSFHFAICKVGVRCNPVPPASSMYPTCSHASAVFLLWTISFKVTIAGQRWLSPVILATQEAEIRRIVA